MWPHCLFLFLLLHKTWAEAESKWEPRLTPASIMEPYSSEGGRGEGKGDG